MMFGILTALRRAAGRSRSLRFRGLHSVRQFRRVLARERARSDRSGDRFSLVVFSPRNAASAEEMRRWLVKILRRRLRLTDEAGWLDADRIGIVLPATPPRGAWKLADDVCRHFSAEFRPLCRVYSYPSDPAQLDEAIPESRRAATTDGDRPPHVEERPSHALEMLFMQRLPVWKRSIDLVGATVGLVVLSPIFLLLAAAIKLSSPGSVFFRQLRSGRGGQPFVMYKFRSMIVEAESLKAELRQHSEQDGPAFKMTDDPRVTRLGRFLRNTSLDELPQLWNVLRGEMTLVGPRPLPCDETAACSAWQRRRLDVTPGLTCIWQVRGRSSVSFNEWVRMDIEYVQRRSLWQDTKILLATVPAVVLRRGAR